MEYIRFVFGLAVGSFINVVAVRYRPDTFLIRKDILMGRSACPHCHRTLRWFELIPLVSFVLQMGKCRSCHVRISFQYLAVELVSGFLFLFVPIAIRLYFPLASFLPLSVLWASAFSVLLLVTLIDLRLNIIPDEANILLVLLGILIAAETIPSFTQVGGSFMGSYALLFGFRESIVLNRLIAFAFGAAFFGLLVLISRGRGMGMGDVKLAAALGILFGWPDILFITALAFILGSCVGVGMIVRGRRTLKSFLPFGPFLAAASCFVFFYGSDMLRLYFGFFHL